MEKFMLEEWKQVGKDFVFLSNNEVIVCDDLNDLHSETSKALCSCMCNDEFEARDEYREMGEATNDSEGDFVVQWYYDEESKKIGFEVSNGKSTTVISFDNDLDGDKTEFGYFVLNIEKWIDNGNVYIIEEKKLLALTSKLFMEKMRENDWDYELSDNKESIYMAIRNDDANVNLITLRTDSKIYNTFPMIMIELLEIEVE